MNMRNGLLAAAVLTGAVLTGATRADRLDSQINAKMPEIMEQLKKKYKNVGVLRVRIQEGDRKETFSSPLSGRLTERIETMLILNNGDQANPSFGIIHDAGTAAAKHKIGSWYSNPVERKKL